MMVRPLRDSTNPNFKIFKADTSKVEAAKRITTKCRSSKEIRPAPRKERFRRNCVGMFRHLTETRVQEVIVIYTYKEE